MSENLKVIRIYAKGRGLIEERIFPDDSQNSQRREVYVYPYPFEEKDFKKHRDLDAERKK